VLAAAPAARTAEAAQLTDRVRLIGAARPGESVPPSQVIQEAITAGHVLVLDYRDRNGAVTVREVEPVAFAGTRAQWYLIGWCRLRDGARAFRVDRIAGAADTGEPAPHRSYRDLRLDIPDALVGRLDLAG
jgi:predicted DNA-binding transcriptional regulator YafY